MGIRDIIRQEQSCGALHFSCEIVSAFFVITVKQASMFKSPLRYPGGKNRLVKIISELAPKDFLEYREPFLGGGSVLLKMMEDYPGRRYWANDLYYDLFCFWNMAQKNPEELVSKIKVIKDRWSGDGKGLHRYLVDNIATMSPIDKAAAFFVLNRITFSGTSLSGGFSKSAFETRFTDSSIERLMSMGQVLQGKDLTITNEDFSSVLTGGDSSVFTFLDPPYYSATDSALYGKNGELHKGFDHERLADSLKDCNHRWLMTYDDCEYIRELYKDFNIKEFELMYGMRNVSKNADMKGKEVFIFNY